MVWPDAAEIDVEVTVALRKEQHVRRQAEATTLAEALFDPARKCDLVVNLVDPTNPRDQAAVVDAAKALSCGESSGVLKPRGWASEASRLLVRASRGRMCFMAPEVMAALLKLPASERVDLALALWESLDEADQQAALDLTPEQAAELDRRLAEHDADPSTAVPWEEVRKKLRPRARISLLRVRVT
jgi:putative addiction module component (TIGR02574 family)